MKSLVKTKLIWDIDGTLLKTNGAAAIPFAKAVSDFAGVNVEIDRKNLSGFTDYEIAMHLLSSHNISFEMRDISEILGQYVQNLPNSLESVGIDLLNNADKTLEKLLNMPAIELLIGTGNCLSGAKVKLEYAGIRNFFSDENFFCSSESHWNRDLVIGKAKSSVAANEIGIVIGDSPRDIISARNSLLYVIAVPSGAHTHAELEIHHPTEILNKNWQYSDLIIAIEKIWALEIH